VSSAQRNLKIDSCPGRSAAERCAAEPGPPRGSIPETAQNRRRRKTFPFIPPHSYVVFLTSPLAVPARRCSVRASRYRCTASGPCQYHFITLWRSPPRRS